MNLECSGRFLANSPLPFLDLDLTAVFLFQTYRFINSLNLLSVPMQFSHVTENFTDLRLRHTVSGLNGPANSPEVFLCSSRSQDFIDMQIPVQLLDFTVRWDLKRGSTDNDQ